MQRVRSDGGSVLPFTAVIVALAVVAAMALVSLVNGSIHRARAQIAADAAALAAAAVVPGGPEAGPASSGAAGVNAARTLIESNGAVMVDYRETWGDDLLFKPLLVTIVADYQGMKAVATAERSVRTLGTGNGDSNDFAVSGQAGGTAVSGVAVGDDYEPDRATGAGGYADLQLGAG